MNYSFPLLNIPEIAMILKEMQLGMTLAETDLTTPDKSAHRIRSVLELLAELTTSTTREEMNQPAFSGLSVLNFPELHEDSIPQLNSFRACCRMMEVCGIDDFSIKDFMYPNPKKLRKHLSGVINFVKFREDRMNILNEQTKQRDALIASMTQARLKNEELNNHLAALKEQTAEEAKAIAALEKDCSSMEATIAELNNEQAEIREESAELKSQNNELRDSISECALQLEELGNAKKKLSAQIVTSPAKFRKNIADVGKAMQQEQQDLRLAERKLRELTSWVTNIDDAQTEVDAALEALIEVKSEVDKQKTVHAELESKRSRLVVDKENFSTANQSVQNLLRQVARSEDKLAHLRKQLSGRSAESQLTVQELSGEVLEAETHRLQLSNRVDRVEGDVAHSESEMATEAAAQEEERGEIASTYQRLERIVILHLQKLRRAVEDARSKGVNCA